MRYPGIYATAADAYGRNCSLSAVDVRPSRLGGTRNVVDVVFSFRHRETDVTDKFSTRVDVTEEFPFLVTKMSPFSIGRRPDRIDGRVLLFWRVEREDGIPAIRVEIAIAPGPASSARSRRRTRTT